MYIKKLAIRNIGPINKLSIDFPFYKNGNPKPIIFVGPNGSGKTILLAQIVDALYEIAGELFKDVRYYEGLVYHYYKITGNLFLNIDSEKGFSLIQFIDNENNKIEYFDKVGNVLKEEFNQLIEDFSLDPNQNNRNNEAKKISFLNEDLKKKLEIDWLSGCYFYYPSYRYEFPFWKNPVYKKEINFKEKEKISYRLNKDIEIISSLKENKSYILDVLLDSYIYPDKTSGNYIWNSINKIIKKIKKRDDIRLGIGPRSDYRVAIVKEDLNLKKVKNILKTIDALSLGELLLLNFAVNIIRYGDQLNNNLLDIKGIVIVDEVDLHLNNDLQYEVLPEIIKLFPRVQFILTTHSPIFLIGMSKLFTNNGFEIIEIPSGSLISSEKFSEFEKAYNILKETKKFDDELKNNIIQLKKPVVFVEGPTDVEYIKKAYELIYEETFNKFDVRIIGQIINKQTINSNNESMKNAIKFLKANPDLIKQRIIFLFDPEEKIKEEEIKNSIFIRKIPFFSSNPIKKGIEHLFNEKTIRKIEEKNQNYFYKGSIGNKIKEIKIAKDEYKKEICEFLCKKGDIEDFKNFKYVFKIINKILKNSN